jgi:hypothetical protein
MKQRFSIAGVLLLLAHLLIGGWAFAKMLEPGHTFDILRLFAMC